MFIQFILRRFTRSLKLICIYSFIKVHIQESVLPFTCEYTAVVAPPSEVGYSQKSRTLRRTADSLKQQLGVGMESFFNCVGVADH